MIGLQSYIVEEGISPGWGCLFVWKRKKDKKKPPDESGGEDFGECQENRFSWLSYENYISLSASTVKTIG